MNLEDAYFFPTYSRKDSDTVRIIIAAILAEGIRVWSDAQLHVGDNWRDALRSSIEGAIGLIFFMSENTAATHFARAELNMVREQGIPIVSAAIDDVGLGFSKLFGQKVFDLSNRENYDAELSRMIKSLHEIVHSRADRFPQLKWHHRSFNDEERRLFQSIIAFDRKLGLDSSIQQSVTQKKRVFVVHGHDSALLHDVIYYLEELGIYPIILMKEENERGNLFDKFWRHSDQAEFAIVLYSPDDFGAAIREYHEKRDGEEVRDSALRFRARQNVVLELGFFYGRLGTDRVVVVQKPPDRYFPPFERPSDLEGLLFEEYDAAGRWKASLKRRLREAGFEV